MFDPYADENGSKFCDGKAKFYVGYHKYLFAAYIESCSYSMYV